MKATGILEPVADGVSGDDGLWEVVGMRHPYVRDAIGKSFWHKSKPRPACIIPILPDNLPGRIGQQNTHFTLHMHKSKTFTNKTLAKFEIPIGAKAGMLQELHRLNTNEFTIYNDLDHLSGDIKRAWQIK